ncbi:MAG: MoaF N-terminal domain-containing protein [Steroidobacteraceae bacterium]
MPPTARDMDIMANRLPSTQSLAGEAIELRYEDGSTLGLRLSASRVQWAMKGAEGPLAGDDPYDAVEMRPGVFFVDFSTGDGARAFSHVIDRERGRALTISSQLIDGHRDLREQLRPAVLAGHASPGEPIAETRELLGRRLFCEYGPEAALEHLYVNSVTLVWQWLRSPPALVQEVGIEAASMWKIRERLYLLATRGEEPIQLTLLLDLERLRNVGRLFGHGQLGRVDRRCGAKITLLGEFTYPEDYRPG